MPVLQGSYPTDSRVFIWKGPLITTEDMYRMDTSSNMRLLILRRLEKITWNVAKTLIERDLYLFGVNNCIWSDNPVISSLDLTIEMLVGRLAEKNTIDELNYWESKYQERLNFDVLSYADRSREISIIVSAFPTKASRIMASDEVTPNVPPSLVYECLVCKRRLQVAFGSTGLSLCEKCQWNSVPVAGGIAVPSSMRGDFSTRKYHNWKIVEKGILQDG